MRIYLDHNATTPLAPEAGAAMSAALAVWGNPSSLHAEGRAARELVERARRQVASLVAAAADELVFTSGGTEADALGIIGLARAARARGARPLLAVPTVEHPAVHGAAARLHEEGFAVRPVRVDERGLIDLDDLAAACAEGAACVAVALANHELGTRQDLAAVADIAHRAGAFVHGDAVQAVGRVPLSVEALGVDALAMSAHKLYGPKGIGALWIRAGIDLAPVIGGGHQERDRRPGTENVLGAVGFGAAADLAAGRVAGDYHRLSELTARFEGGLRAIPGTRIHGDGAPRLPGTVNAGFAGALGEVVVTALDLDGVAASTGAACTSGTVEPSPVLLALGLPVERATEAVRFGLGRGTTAEQLEVVLEVLPSIIARARQFR